MHAAVECLEERRLFAAGSLDTTFGPSGVGWVKIPAPYGQRWALNDLAIQPNGKAIGVGYQQTPAFTNVKAALTRITANGSVDASFGGNGVVVDSLSATEGNALVAVVYNDLKITALGYIEGPQTGRDWVLVRYNTDGTRDTGFGVNGMARLDFAGSFDDPHALLLQDGKLLAAGAATFAGNVYPMMALARFNYNGTIDTTFGVGGIATTDKPYGQDQINDITISGTDIIPAGTRGPTNYISEGILARFSADGVFDHSFGVNGFFVDYSYGLSAVTTLPDGKLAASSFDHDLMGVTRRTANGQYDPSFNGVGYAYHSIYSNYETTSSIVAQPDGKLIIGGAGNGVRLSRYNTDGTVDSSFGADTNTSPGTTYILVDGTYEGQYSYFFDEMQAMKLTGNGKLLTAGATGQGGFLFTRFNLGLPSVAVASGPTEAWRGDLVPFSGSGSYDQDGSVTRYEWDRDWGGDPEQFDVDSVGQSLLFDTGLLANGSTRTLGLRVQDNIGAYSEVVPLSVLIKDPAPQASISPTPSVVRGQPAQFSGSASIVMPGDTLEVGWDFGDATYLPYAPSGAPGAFTPTHAYASAGAKTVTMSIMGTRATVAPLQTVTVNIAQLQPNPNNTSQNDLVVGGTAGANNVQITTASGGGVKVTVDGVSAGVFNPTGRILLYGYDGNDTLQVANGVTLPAILIGGAGDDLLIGGGGNDTLDGGDGNDKLIGGPGSDTFIGGAGTDEINFVESFRLTGVRVSLDGINNDGWQSSNTSSGNALNFSNVNEHDNVGGDIEIIAATNFADYIDASSGANAMIINGYGGNDTLIGGAGNDVLYGESGNDLLYGGAGDDLFYGGSGNEIFYGGAGLDEMSYADGFHTTGVSVSMDPVANDGNESDGPQGARDYLTGDVEVVTGTAYNDTLDAQNYTLPVTFRGGAGNDLLIGGTGNDTLDGGDGDDKLMGGAGSDVIIGGAGGYDEVNFIEYFRATGVRVTLDGIANDGWQGTNSSSGDALFANSVNEGDNIAADVEVLAGSWWNDYLSAVGRTSTTLINGYSGNDRLFGGSGVDWIWGDYGDDILNGGPGFDTLDGGPNWDTAIGYDDFTVDIEAYA